MTLLTLLFETLLTKLIPHTIKCVDGCEHNVCTVVMIRLLTRTRLIVAVSASRLAPSAVSVRVNHLPVSVQRPNVFTVDLLESREPVLANMQCPSPQENGELVHFNSGRCFPQKKKNMAVVKDTYRLYMKDVHGLFR